MNAQHQTATTTPTPPIGSFASHLRAAVVALAIFTLLTGVAYPALVTGIAQVVFPSQANGSILRDANGIAVGSALIGQNFDTPEYFWGRLSATGTFPYNAFNADSLTASSGSNLGPMNEALVGPDGTIQARISALQAADPGNTAPIPVDLVTASGSGLDPHISPAAAAYQVERVARARGIDIAQVQTLVARYTEGRTLGILGEPRVNVLELNLALDGR